MRRLHLFQGNPATVDGTVALLGSQQLCWIIGLSSRSCQVVPDRFAEPKEESEGTQNMDISCLEFHPVGRGAVFQ